MKTEYRDILGLSVPVAGVVETLAEAVEAAGSEETVLNDFVSQVLFHSHYAVMRKTIAEATSKATGISRLTKEHNKKQVWAESEADYLERVIAEVGGVEVFNEQHLAAVQAACAAIPVDYKPGVRGTGAGSKPAKKWLEAVADLKKEGRFDAFIEKYGITGDEEEQLVNNAANKVKELILARQKAAAREALAGV